MGAAGLLPKQLKATWDAETKAFVRTLWDLWWKKRERWEHRILSVGSWRLAGLRPTNRPERRIMAAADLLSGTNSGAVRTFHRTCAALAGIRERIYWGSPTVVFRQQARNHRPRSSEKRGSTRFEQRVHSVSRRARHPAGSRVGPVADGSRQRNGSANRRGAFRIRLPAIAVPQRLAPAGTHPDLLRLLSKRPLALRGL